MSLKSLLFRQGPPRSAAEPHDEASQFGDVAPYYDHLMRAVPYTQWVDYIEALLRHRGARPCDVLDLCCGTGRAGSILRHRGYDAIGADLSEPMVRECRHRTPPLAAVVSDATALAFRESTFDLAISVYDSLNYILDPQALARCFIDVARCLRPGALFIFDVNTPRALSSGLFNQDNLRTEDPLLYSWKAHWDSHARICTVNMSFKWRGGEGPEVEFEETHRQYAYRNEEILGMLDDAGFVHVTPFHAYTFRPLTRWSDRAYYVARKE